MKKLVFFNLILINIISHIKLENNNNIISLKFKTYYPFSNITLNELFSFTTDNYMENIHLSKLYLEVGVGDENSFKSKSNQTLNIIIGLKEIIFSTTDIYFKKYTSENNNLLCHYNTSKSSTFSEHSKYYKLEDIESLSSFATELFQIYTDISLSKFTIQKLNFVNTINHNINEICGYIGLVYTHIESCDYNFICQLHSKLNLSTYIFVFNYTNENSDEGIFTFGNMPDAYLPKKFKSQNFINIPTKSNRDILITSYRIVLERDGYKIDSSNQIFELKISPDIEGFEYSENSFRDIEDIFFYKYINKKICHKEVYARIYYVIYCDAGQDKFGEKDIKYFPNMTFYLKQESNLSVCFNGKDLFYFKENKYFFKIIENVLGTNLILGRIFFKKYLTLFDLVNKQIFLYDDKNDNPYNNDNNKKIKGSNKTIKIIIICSIICAFIFFPLGIYFGNKIFKKRGKKAYELNDGYDYSPAQDNNDHLNIN